MAGRRKKPPQPYMIGRNVLENIHDTGATTDEPSTEHEAKRKHKEQSVKVDPPFRGPKVTEPSFDLAALLPGLKFAAKYALPFLGLAATIIWYASKLDSNVDSLQVEVKDISAKTEELVKSSIQQSGRLDNIEMAISRNTAPQNAKATTTEHGPLIQRPAQKNK